MLRLLAAAFAVGASVLIAAQTRPASPRLASRFSVVEATIPEMRQAMQDGRVTARELVTQYLTRIAMYEDRIYLHVLNRGALDVRSPADRL